MVLFGWNIRSKYTGRKPYHIRKLNCTSSNIYQINSSYVQKATDFF